MSSINVCIKYEWNSFFFRYCCIYVSIYSTRVGQLAERLLKLLANIFFWFWTSLKLFNRDCFGNQTLEDLRFAITSFYFLLYLFFFNSIQLQIAFKIQIKRVIIHLLLLIVMDVIWMGLLLNWIELNRIELKKTV